MIQSSVFSVWGQKAEETMSVSRDKMVEVGVLGNEESEENEITEEVMVRSRSAM